MEHVRRAGHSFNTKRGTLTYRLLMLLFDEEYLAILVTRSCDVAHN